MVEAALNLVLLLLGLALAVVWIVAIAQWDGTTDCSEGECDACPFPCGKHKERGTKNE